MNNTQQRATRALILAAALALSACAAPPPPPAPAAPLAESVTPKPNLEPWATSWWMPRHQAKTEEARLAGTQAQLLFLGDSITHSWESSGKQVWQQYYQQYHALNLGFSGDRTEHMLWRLQHGEVDGLQPKVVVLMAGTNNAGHRQEDGASIAAALGQVIGELRRRMPAAKILVLGIFPRADRPGPQLGRIIDAANAQLPALADERQVFFLNMNKALLQPDGTLSTQVMPDLLHPNANGYALWAQAMEPTLQKLMNLP